MLRRGVQRFHCRCNYSAAKHSFGKPGREHSKHSKRSDCIEPRGRSKGNDRSGQRIRVGWDVSGVVGVELVVDRDAVKRQLYASGTVFVVGCLLFFFQTLLHALQLTGLASTALSQVAPRFIV